MSVHKQPLLTPPYTDLKAALEARGVALPPDVTPHALVRAAVTALAVVEPPSYTAGRQREADTNFVRSLINSTSNKIAKEAYEYAADLVSKNTLVTSGGSSA